MKGRKRRRREERKTEAKCRKSHSLERKRQRKMELGVRNFAFFLTGSIRYSTATRILLVRSCAQV